MLLRRHKINSVRQGNPDNVVEDKQQEELYGEELQYKAKDEEKESTEEKPYTKTDINKMNKEKLLEVAQMNGFEPTDETTGAELKEYLIGVFEL